MFVAEAPKVDITPFPGLTSRHRAGNRHGSDILAPAELLRLMPGQLS
jgi:hypothetical protein